METIILNAIKICQKEIQDNPMLILSESDFERLLAHNISILISKSQNEAIKKFVVHTQVSFYGEKFDSEPQYRVDILLMKQEEIEEHIQNHKGFKYASKAYVIEVKYFHKKDDVTQINSDLEKAKQLLNNNSHLYVVALLEFKNEKITEKLNNLYQTRKQELIENNYPNKNLHINILYKQ